MYDDGALWVIELILAPRVFRRKVSAWECLEVGVRQEFKDLVLGFVTGTVLMCEWMRTWLDRISHDRVEEGSSEDLTFAYQSIVRRPRYKNVVWNVFATCGPNCMWYDVLRKVLHWKDYTLSPRVQYWIPNTWESSHTSRSRFSIWVYAFINLSRPLLPDPLPRYRWPYEPYCTNLLIPLIRFHARVLSSSFSYPPAESEV